MECLVSGYLIYSASVYGLFYGEIFALHLFF